tara:strand:- start:1350 stop:1646 length:297 start_codon:yes stop_codon:yes gene_type:complete
MNMKKKSILDNASMLIDGERAKDYGPALLNHERIADGWNVIVKSAMEKHGELLPSHVAMMMAWVKIARLCNTKDHQDSWIDLVAYGALGGEFSEEEDK